jgi:hypothetical protein
MTPSQLAQKAKRAESTCMDESNAKSDQPSAPLTFAEAMRQMNWGGESKTSPEDSKKPLPSTLAEAARQMNWGAGDRSLAQDPKTDRVFITTTGTTDPNWTPGPEDWERLAEMFRGR